MDPVASGGMCDNTWFHYNPDPNSDLDFRAKMELVCKQHAYFQVEKDDN